MKRNSIFFLLLISFILTFYSCLESGNEKELILSNISSLGSEDFSVRIRSENFLIKKGKKAVPYLIEALKDNNRYIREGSVRVLGEIKVKEAVDPLIEILRHEEDWIIRSYAALSLGEIGDTRAVEPLIHVLKSRSIVNVMASSSAAKALGLLGDNRAVKPLINSLKDISIMANSIEALGRIGNPMALPPLMEILSLEKDMENIKVLQISLLYLEEAQDKLILALGSKNKELKDQAEKVFLETGKDAIPLLLEDVEIREPSVRLGIVGVLNKIGDLEALEGLTLMLDKETDPHIKTEITYSIKNLGGSFQNLIKLLGGSDLAKRKEAMERLISIGNEAVLPLISSLEKNDPSEYGGIIEVLGEIKDPRAVKPLIEKLSTEDPLVRYLIIEALIKIDERDMLIDALENKDHKVRSGICEVLGNIKEEKALPLLLNILKDDNNDDVKESAAMAISNIGSSDTIEPLMALLYDRNSKTVVYSIEALGELNASESFNILVEKLSDYNSLVRAAAAESLGKLNNMDAILPLENALLEEENFYVREKIEFAIGEIQKKEELPDE